VCPVTRMGGDSAKLDMRSPTAREATACSARRERSFEDVSGYINLCTIISTVQLRLVLRVHQLRAALSFFLPSAQLLHSIATLQASACRNETASPSQSTLPKQSFILAAFTRSSEGPVVLQRYHYHL
jgi:hypothetical protein